MSWSSNNRLIVKRLKGLIEEYRSKPNALNIFFESKTFKKYCLVDQAKTIETHQAEITLLAGCLNQGIKEVRLFAILDKLLLHCSDKIFALPAPKQRSLIEIIQLNTQGIYWEIREQAPGIIWSVGEFVRKNNIVTLIESNDYNTVLEELSSSVFYMGAHSERKTKAKRLYNWFVLPHPVGIGLNAATNPDTLEIAISENAHRFMRDFGPLKDKTRAFPNSDERMRYFRSFYSFLVPGFPHLVEHLFYNLNHSKFEELFNESHNV
ncbi:MAG: hypothetical protein OCC49_00040 [Fibrobacterales bacterium]